MGESKEGSGRRVALVVGCFALGLTLSCVGGDGRDGGASFEAGAGGAGGGDVAGTGGGAAGAGGLGGEAGGGGVGGVGGTGGADGGVDGGGPRDGGADAGLPWLATPGFHSYAYSATTVREVGDAGIVTFNVDTNVFGDESGFSTASGLPDGGWDYAPLLSTIALIRQAQPQARFILRVAAGAPTWWMDQHPAELEAHADGCTYFGSARSDAGACVGPSGALDQEPAFARHVSLASDLVAARWRDGLVRLKAALDGAGVTPRVDAVTLTGQSSQEWVSFDAHFFTTPSVRPLAYGAAHVAGYRAWLVQRFGATVAGLTMPTEAEFAAANFANPSAFLDLGQSWGVAAYALYRSELAAQTIGRLATEVKAVFGPIKVGAIYGYSNEFGGAPGFGHNGLGSLLAAPAVDFINPMSSYQDRVVGGADYERQPLTSVGLHGKLVLNDLDKGTHVSKQNYDWLCEQYRLSSDPVLQNVWRLNCQSGDPASQYEYALAGMGFEVDAQGHLTHEPNAFETVSALRRWLGYTLHRDLRFSYLSLHNTTAPPGQERSYLSDPALLDTVVPQLNAVTARSVGRSKASVAQVLVISDEDSSAFARHWPVQPNFVEPMRDVGGLEHHALSTPRYALARLGAPYDHVLLSDLPRLDTTPYKLVLVLNAWHVTSAMRAVIAQKLKTGSKVVVWNYAAGLFQDGVKALQSASNLVEIDLANLPLVRAPSVSVVPDPVGVFTQSHLAQPPFVADCCDFLYAADGRAHVLGYHVGTQYVSLALRDLGSWKSVWTATAALPPAALRELARYAGVHLYSDTDEPLYVNASYATLVVKHAGAVGQRTLRFPRPVDLYEAVGETPLAQRVTTYGFGVSDGSVVLLRYQ